MKDEEKGYVAYLKEKLLQLREWIRPDPNDSHLLKVVKLFYKSIALLVLLAFSPVLLVILLFVFFAAI
jgi:hypothetical protein